MCLNENKNKLLRILYIFRYLSLSILTYILVRSLTHGFAALTPHFETIVFGTNTVGREVRKGSKIGDHQTLNSNFFFFCWALVSVV